MCGLFLSPAGSSSHFVFQQSAVTCLLWPEENTIVFGLVEGKVRFAEATAHFIGCMVECGKEHTQMLFQWLGNPFLLVCAPSWFDALSWSMAEVCVGWWTEVFLIFIIFLFPLYIVGLSKYFSPEGSPGKYQD